MIINCANYLNFCENNKGPVLKFGKQLKQEDPSHPVFLSKGRISFTGVKRSEEKVILSVNMQMKSCLRQKDTAWWTHELDHYCTSRHVHSWKLVSENVNTFLISLKAAFTLLIRNLNSAVTHHAKISTDYRTYILHHTFLMVKVIKRYMRNIWKLKPPIFNFRLMKWITKVILRTVFWHWQGCLRKPL